WRRSTASSWRSTTISSSLNSPERKRSAATASARRNSRYSNDTTKKQPPPPESEDADSTAATQLRDARRTTGWICAPDTQWSEALLATNHLDEFLPRGRARLNRRAARVRFRRRGRRLERGCGGRVSGGCWRRGV